MRSKAMTIDDIGETATEADLDSYADFLIMAGCDVYIADHGDDMCRVLHVTYPGGMDDDSIRQLYLDWIIEGDDQ